MQFINSPDAPKPRGPYSPAVRAGDFLFIAGQVPLDPATQEFSFGSIEHETKLVFQHIDSILKAAGATRDQIVRCGVYLSNGDDFAAMNGVYAEFFGEHRPARSTIVVGFATKEMKVEIDAVAYLGK
jgi:2-iminobutanoate/2-iminopropanoate deaminase